MIRKRGKKGRGKKKKLKLQKFIKLARSINSST